jgi:hypothetical protein
MAHTGALAPRPPPRYMKRMNPFDFLVPIAVLVVFGILCVGIYALFRGGDFGRTYSNKLMRFRVLAQFVAVLLLVAGFYWKQHH